MANKSNEQTFQNDIINQMIANGWLLGTPDGYNRKLALYEEDLFGFVQDTQDEQWQKYCLRNFGDITLIIENKNSGGYLFALGTLFR